MSSTFYRQIRDQYLSQRSERPRGVAIIMVMVVLTGLLALAAPFVFSMILHQREARYSLNEAQATNGALASLDHGISYLHKRLMKAEGHDPTPDLDTYDELLVPMSFTAAAQAGIEVNKENPNGEIWSTKIEDEQGKINLLTAPPALLGNLLGSALLAEGIDRGAREAIVDDISQFYSDGDDSSVDGWVGIGGDLVRYKHIVGNRLILAPADPFTIRQNHAKGALVYDGRGAHIARYIEGEDRASYRPFRSIYEIKAISNAELSRAIRPDEFTRIERFITINSGRDTQAWGPLQQLSGGVTATQRSFDIENGESFGPGSRFRLLQRGQILRYDLVESVRPTIKQGREVWEVNIPYALGLDRTANKNHPIYLQSEIAHPINLNTASIEVIRACVKGVCLFGSSEAVSDARAYELAHLLTVNVYRNHEDLRKALNIAEERGILTPQMRDAVYINATGGASPKLRTSTVPFCYRSHGTFTVEGSASVNSKNGVELARKSFRQTITLPKPPTNKNDAFTVKSQEKFQKLVNDGMGLRVVTWPTPMNPSTVRFQTKNSTKEPNPDRGDVRLSVGEVGSHVDPTGRGGTRGNNRRPPQAGNLINTSTASGSGGDILDEYIDHCDDPDHPAFFQEGYDFRRMDPIRLPAVPLKDRNRQGHMPTTGVELWFKPENNNSFTIFDQADEPERNRATFYYTRGALVVQIWDANLEGNSVIYRYPAELQRDRWYHLAASWRSTHYQGQEIRLDGKLLPLEGETNFHPGSRLATALSLEEINSLDLEDASGFPQAGAVQVGEEIIEYEGNTGTSLTKLRRGVRMSTAASHSSGSFAMPFGFTFTEKGLKRGGATLMDDIALESAMKSAITVGKIDEKDTQIKATGITNFPKNGFAIVGGEIVYYASRSATSLDGVKRGMLRTTATKKDGSVRIVLISIRVSNHNEYPDNGFVQIDNDAYPGGDYIPTVNPFRNPTVRNGDTYVEWFRYGQKLIESGGHYLISDLHYHSHGSVTTAGRHRFRGRANTSDNQTHSKGAKVIPCYHISVPVCGDQFTPYGANGISSLNVFYENEQEGDIRWVKRAFVRQTAHTRTRRVGNQDITEFVDWNFEFYIALDDFLSRTYDSEVRILKFPSGDLPYRSIKQRVIGSSFDGDDKLLGKVDEIKVLALNSSGAKVAMDLEGSGVRPGDPSILLELPAVYAKPNGFRNAEAVFPANGGVVRINDEFISYQSAKPRAGVRYIADVFRYKTPYYDNEHWIIEMGSGKDDDDGSNDQLIGQLKPGKLDRRWRNELQINGDPSDGGSGDNEIKTVLELSGLTRGLFNTQEDSHSPGAGVMLYDAAPVSTILGSCSATSDSFTVRDARGFPSEGYAYVNNEIISWQERSGNTFKGCEPFRGRFGTSPNDHHDGDLILALPFRYWDRYPGIEYDGPGQAYIQNGYYIDNAIWDAVELEIEGPDGEPLPSYVVPYTLVRFNGAPDWETPPSNKPGGIYAFQGSGLLPFRGFRNKLGVQAEQIEVRVYWRFLRGSFHPGEDWKRTFALKSMRAIFHSPLIMGRLDQLE